MFHGIGKDTALSSNNDIRRAAAARRQRGFTLIEIMVVVVILGILSALVLPNVLGRVDDARKEAARTEIRNIEGALKLYRLDNFRYPTADQGLEALVSQPADPNIRNWRQYLPKMPNDPWGTPYQYEVPGRAGADFDLYSLGADGQPGGEGVDADIGNWDID